MTDNMPARITYVNSDFRFRFANKAVSDDYMIPKEKIIGNRIVDVLGEGFLSERKIYFDRAFDGETVVFETSRKNKEDQIVYFMTKLVPHFNEKIKLFAVTIASKHIELHNKIKQDRLVLADNNMLQSIFRNLISNAIKFTPVGGEIVISSAPMDGYEQITVSDNGIGMSLEDSNKIFQNRFRAHYHRNKW